MRYCRKPNPIVSQKKNKHQEWFKKRKHIVEKGDSKAQMFSHKHLKENNIILLQAKPFFNDGSGNKEILTDFYDHELKYHESKTEALLCMKNNLHPELVKLVLEEKSQGLLKKYC